jgi:triphosphatase
METELKFQVPPQTLDAVRRAVDTASARHIVMQARYFDTPDRCLAAAGIALRLRLEGQRWVQAVKAPGAHAMVRFEHEVVLEGDGTEPLPDLARHAGTAVAATLADALAAGSGPLQVVFETRFDRTWRVLRHAGAVVELALDIGEVRAGARRAPLCEVEFELRSGAVAGLLSLAARWVQRHGLWLDVRSKAERGQRLARGASAGPAVPANAPLLRAEMTGDAALRAIVGACLAQVLPNAADLAAGVGGPEHLHQLRVGLRRLRCALRLFGDLSPVTGPRWAAVLRELFGVLGARRDRDVLLAVVLPALREAGAPLAELPPAPAQGVSVALLCGPQFNRLLLDLMAFAHAAAAASPDAPAMPVAPFGELVWPRLEHLRRQLRRDAKGFAAFDEVARHRSRKRLKRLRYGLDFVGGWLAPKVARRCQARLKDAQDLLGRYHDLAVAEQAFSAQVPHDPRAWFAVGWLQAQREQLVQPARAALAGVAASARRLRRGKQMAGKGKGQAMR